LEFLKTKDEKVLFATGDTMAQQLVEKKGFDKHELGRTGRMALYGGGMYIRKQESVKSGF